ncbi:MAG: TRAP transporter small permease [Alphaproteobacteria bacterium]|nr:TRAP transporter small permease [Alphaproteobacteria bacterium]
MSKALHLEKLAVGVLGFVAMLVAVYSTAARYFFPSLAPDWGEEIVVYLSTWALWLSVGSLARVDGHIRAEVVTHRLSLRVQKFFEVLHCVFGMGFCGFIAVAGAEVVQMSLDVGEHSDSMLMLPLWLY